MAPPVARKFRQDNFRPQLRAAGTPSAPHVAMNRALTALRSFWFRRGTCAGRWRKRGKVVERIAQREQQNAIDAFAEQMPEVPNIPGNEHVGPALQRGTEHWRILRSAMHGLLVEHWPPVLPERR